MPAKKNANGVVGKLLSRAKITETALELIESAGLDALSTRKLGAALGVEAMSIYHHFPNKAHLLDAVAEQLLLRINFPEEEGLTWWERIRLALLAYRDVALRHPNTFVLLATRRYNTPLSLGILERFLGLYQQGGFTPADSARWFRIGGHFVTGAALTQNAILDSERSSHPLMMRNLKQEDLPLVSQAAPYFGSEHFERNFHDGLNLIIRAMRTEADSRVA